MLGTIRDILFGIFDFFQSIGDWITNGIQEVTSFISVIGHVIGAIPRYASILPLPLVSGILSLSMLAVFFRVIGREG